MLPSTVLVYNYIFCLMPRTISFSQSPQCNTFHASCIHFATPCHSRLPSCLITPGSATGAKDDTSRESTLIYRDSTTLDRLRNLLARLSRHGRNEDRDLHKLQGESSKVNHHGCVHTICAYPSIILPLSYKLLSLVGFQFPSADS
jgi:hypothetical protein